MKYLIEAIFLRDGLFIIDEFKWNGGNIAIFKCYDGVAKNFFKNVGTYIVSV
jgi:hypothetical protein